MSSTSHALGPKEPPAPPNWVMGQPYRRRSAPGGGLVASALPMSYPAALHVLSRPAPAPGAATVVFVHGSLDRGESFRRVMRRLPDLTTAGLRPPGLPGLPGRRGGGPRAATSRISLQLGTRRGRPGAGRWSPSATASGATSWWARRWPSRGPSTPSGPSSRRCPGSASAATGPAGPGPGRPWPRTPARRPSASSPGWWAPRRGPASPSRAGRSAAPTVRRWWRTCAACGARARPSTSPRSASPPCSAWVGRRRSRITVRACSGWAGTSPERSSTRFRGPSTARTCRTRTTSPR